MTEKTIKRHQCMCINISSKKSEEINKMAEILNIDIDLFLDC